MPLGLKSVLIVILVMGSINCISQMQLIEKEKIIKRQKRVIEISRKYFEENKEKFQYIEENNI